MDLGELAVTLLSLLVFAVVLVTIRNVISDLRNLRKIATSQDVIIRELGAIKEALRTKNEGQ